MSAQDRNRTIALSGGIAVVLLVIVALGYGVMAGRDIASYAPTLLGFALPAVTTLFAMSRFNKELGEIHDKVNGNYSKVTGDNEILNQAVRAMLAVAPPDIARQILATLPQSPAPTEDTRPEGRHRA